MKVLNFGSLNVDYVYDVPHFVTPGETITSFARGIFATSPSPPKKPAGTYTMRAAWAAMAISCLRPFGKQV